MLARFHLRLRPVDRVDLRLRSHRCKKVIGRPAVVLEEAVALDVINDVGIPLLCFSTVKRGRMARLISRIEEGTSSGMASQLGKSGN